MSDSFADRIAYGARLLERRAGMSADWEANVITARADGDDVLRLCLVHPEWYLSGMALGQSDPRGSRRFKTPPPIGEACQSLRIWGYSCSLPSERLEADHLFPYESGGPTDGRNLVWLCSWHNRVKSNDIHLVPWSTVDLSWVDEVLERIRIRRGTLRLRGLL